MILLASAGLFAWLYLAFFHGRFWQSGPFLRASSAPASSLPEVAVVVPARDEAESIGAALRSLLEQDYGGKFSVILVDDNSRDGTGDLARALPDPAGRLTVLTGAPRPGGWSGKLWAVKQGVDAALERIAPEGFVFLTDADIVHAPSHLSALMLKARSEELDLVSEMVALNCESAAERWLVPAFVYFFAKLYPFSRVAKPGSRVAGAAGGTMLVRRAALERIGGIESLKGALIDDCTLAAHIKRSGGKLYLGHSALARSVRPYPGARAIWDMITRTAYTQLRYSPLMLLWTVLGMALIWLSPPGLALFGKGKARRIGAVSWLLSSLTYLPTLRRFGLPFWRALFLPLVAVFYMAATIGSAVNHHRGVGARWKDRAYTDETS